MKKKIAKIVLSSGTLTTIAFIIILIPVLMIMDFFGANITDDYVENNAEYASEYKRVLNQNLKNGNIKRWTKEMNKAKTQMLEDLENMMK